MHMASVLLKLFMVLFLPYHLMLGCHWNHKVYRNLSLRVPKFTHRSLKHWRSLQPGWNIRRMATAVTRLCWLDRRSGLLLGTCPWSMGRASWLRVGLDHTCCGSRWRRRHGGLRSRLCGRSTMYSTAANSRLLWVTHVCPNLYSWRTTRRLSLRLIGCWIGGWSGARNSSWSGGKVLGRMRTRGSPRATWRTARSCWGHLGVSRRVLGRAHGVARDVGDLGGQSPNDGVFRVCCFCFVVSEPLRPVCRNVRELPCVPSRPARGPPWLGSPLAGPPGCLLWGATTWAWLSMGATGSLGDTSWERPCMLELVTWGHVKTGGG